MKRAWTKTTAALAVGLAAALTALPSVAQTTLKIVMHSDLKIVDPIWTTAYITRNHGYMIYDTLFAMDAKGEIQPQMVEKYETSPDKLTFTFTLRPGLAWHDGKPVTSEDCIASIKRWGAKDGMGQKLMSFVAELAAVDAKTFTMKLKEPTGLVLTALGKPSSNVPFMMPKRVADGDPNTQLSEFVGSGPFVFKTDEWKPGDKTVYVKNDKYVPRPEPASGLAGANNDKSWPAYCAFDRYKFRYHRRRNWPGTNRSPRWHSAIFAQRFSSTSSAHREIAGWPFLRQLHPAGWLDNARRVPRLERKVSNRYTEQSCPTGNYSTYGHQSARADTAGNSSNRFDTHWRALRPVSVASPSLSCSCAACALSRILP